MIVKHSYYRNISRAVAVIGSHRNCKQHASETFLREEEKEEDDDDDDNDQMYAHIHGTS